MIKRKKCIVLAVAAFFVLSFCVPLSADQSQKTTVEKLLDILQNKGIITEKQHGELTEELGVEKKELEEQKKVVEEVKLKEEQRPRVGYKNGFYLETPDKDFKLKIGGRRTVISVPTTAITRATMNFTSAGPGSIFPEPYTNTLTSRLRLILEKGEQLKRRVCKSKLLSLCTSHNGPV